MRFPKTIRHRKAEAVVYGKTAAYPFYRVAVRVAGKRRLTSFGTYSDALAAAEKAVRDLSNGNTVAALTPKQAADALTAFQQLDALHQDTGRRVSLLTVVSEYASVVRKLNGRPVGEAVDGFLKTVVSVKRVDLGKAVEEFIQGREHLTKAAPGKRPQLSAGYHYNVSMWLREFAGTFPNTAVSDLNKDLLNRYLTGFADLSARSRNVRRIVVTMFLAWCVRNDYLAEGHRLLEADRMKREDDTPEAIEFYSPKDLAALLKTANENDEHRQLLPVIALCGLAGLRLQEAVRLEWADVWRVEGHVEISSAKSKTRSRRLVNACPSLLAWLEPYRASEGPVWAHTLDRFHSDFGALRDSLKIPARRNGLRHGFCTYHFSLNSNENLTSAQAGNSPAMIHGCYKGLATKKQGEAWFAVAPVREENVISLAAAEGSR